MNNDTMNNETRSSTRRSTRKKKKPLAGVIYVTADAKIKLYQKTAFISGSVGIPLRPSEVCNYFIEVLIDDNMDELIKYFKKKAIAIKR